MGENLHGLAANDEGGNATTAMRGHDDEVTAAGPGGLPERPAEPSLDAVEDAHRSQPSLTRSHRLRLVRHEHRAFDVDRPRWQEQGAIGRTMSQSCMNSRKPQ